VLLKAAQAVLGISDPDFAAIESTTRSSSYLAALREVWKDGVVTPEEAEHLEHLRKLLNVPAEEHLKLESQIRRESQAKKCLPLSHRQFSPPPKFCHPNGAITPR
jgi:uncharacterized protein YutE (UPF0331/DUF86 family)